jgi:hypothetical protein
MLKNDIIPSYLLSSLQIQATVTPEALRVLRSGKSFAFVLLSAAGMP